MKTKLEQAQEIYTELFAIMKANQEVCVFGIMELERQAENHLFGIKLQESYRLNINPKHIYSTHINVFFNEWVSIYRVGAKYDNLITNSDSGKQPKNELLVVIRFTTGPFCLSPEYPRDLFLSMLEEFKTYAPTYTDLTNNALYYSIDQAAGVFNSFEEIYTKYKKLALEQDKSIKINKLKVEIERLQNSEG